MYEIIRKSYYWFGLKEDCIKYVTKNLPMRIERQKWVPPKYLYPVPKGVRPFQSWVIDTLKGLTPPDPRGCTSMAVAICPFSKWVEAGPLLDGSAEEMVSWVHLNLVCRYGKPTVIRTDNGPEFSSVF